MINASTVSIEEPLKVGINRYFYSKSQKLGEGAFGTVYKGRTENDKEVAIKFIQVTDGEYGNELFETLKNEVEIMQTIRDRIPQDQRDYFVKLYDFEIKDQEKKIIIVMEYCNLKDLRSYMSKNKEINEKIAIDLLHQLISGLQALSKIQIMHRDLKPANIMLNSAGKIQVKLTDFGFSKKMQHREALDQSIVGTPLYMAPQIVSQERYSHKADIWSLGVIYYQMLFNKTPWPEDAYSVNLYMNKIKQRVPLEYPKIPNITKESKDFIERCLKYEEAERIDYDEMFETPLIKKYLLPQQTSNTDLQPSSSSNSGASNLNQAPDATSGLTGNTKKAGIKFKITETGTAEPDGKSIKEEIQNFRWKAAFVWDILTARAIFELHAYSRNFPVPISQSAASLSETSKVQTLLIQKIVKYIEYLMGYAKQFKLNGMEELKEIEKDKQRFEKEAKKNLKEGQNYTDVEQLNQALKNATQDAIKKLGKALLEVGENYLERELKYLKIIEYLFYLDQLFQMVDKFAVLNEKEYLQVVATEIQNPLVRRTKLMRIVADSNYDISNNPN